jgi:hypothetical protein
MHANDPHDYEGQPPPPRQHVLTLPFILALGWLIYEVTAQPALAAMAMCLKFGWEDFRTARWLQLSDPDRARGRACYWLYLSSGLWKVAISGLAMIFLISALVTLMRVNRNQAQQVAPMLAAAGITLVLGFGFSALASYVAFWTAWRHRVRLWLNGAVYRARVRNDWPPHYGQVNRAGVLAVTTIIVTCLFIIPVAVGLACYAAGDHLADASKRTLFGLASVASWFVLLPALLVKYLGVQRSLFARHPDECWGDELPILPDVGDSRDRGAIQ